MNKKSMIKIGGAGLIVFLIIALFLIIVLPKTTDADVLTRNQYKLGEEVRISFIGKGEYDAKIITPTVSFVRVGSNDAFTFNPEEIGNYTIELTRGGQKTKYFFEVIKTEINQDDKTNIFSISQEYFIGEELRINLIGKVDYEIKVFTPTKNYTRKGSNDNAIFILDEIGKFIVEILIGGKKFHYEFDVLNKTEYFDEEIIPDNINEKEKIIVGKSVRHFEKLNFDKETKKVKIDVPYGSKNITLYKINNNQSQKIDYIETESSYLDLLLNLFSRKKSKSITVESIQGEIELVYFTEGPKKIEKSLSKSGKEVIISSQDDVKYENVTAYTEIERKIKNKGDIRIFWKEEGRYLDFETHDNNNDGFIDVIEWIVPHLSEQTFDIIYIIKAEHLNLTKDLIEEVYSYVKEKDGIYKTIPESNFLRVTFERNLSSINDITIYAKNNNSNPIIEVYEKDSNQKLADFGIISNENWYRILLNNLSGIQDTFDLKILNGDIDFDYVVDPSINVSKINRTQGNIIGDSWVYDRAGYEDFNYGTSPDLWVRRHADRRARTYIMFNITSVPTGATINESYLCMYLHTDDTTTTAEVHHVYIHNWSEGSVNGVTGTGSYLQNITWNNQPCGTGFTASTLCNLSTTQNITSTTAGWKCWNVTEIIKKEYNSGYKNASFVFKATAETASNVNPDYFASKEYSTNYSRSPYLNITYTINRVPVITNLNLNSTYGMNTTEENLTCKVITSLDDDGDNVNNIITWNKNGSSYELLVAPFEGGSNSTFTKDYSPFKNNGRVINGVLFNLTGGYDRKGAYWFDGTNKSIDFGNSPTLALTNNFTISLWLRKTDKTTFERYLSHSSGASTYAFEIGTDQVDTSQWRVRFNSDAFTFTVPINTTTTPQWIHLAISYNKNLASQNLKFYENGRLIGTGDFNLDLIGHGNLRTNRINVANGYMNSYLDELRIFNSTLSLQQIKSIYMNKSNVIVSQELMQNQRWYCIATPNDGYIDGLNVTSNYLIVGAYPPTSINIINPRNNSYTTNPFNLTAITDQIGSCQYSTNSNFTFGSGIDFTGGQGTRNHTTIMNLSDGIYTYFIKCNNSDNIRNDDTNQNLTTFIIDSIPPLLRINSPWNITNDVTPNFSIAIYENVSKLWYSLNGGVNTTICNNCTPGNYTRFLFLNEGNFLLRVYGNDSPVGNIGLNISNFTINMNKHFSDSYNDNSSLGSLFSVNWSYGNISFYGEPLASNEKVFVESSGMIVIEAENYSKIIIRGAKSWNFTNTYSGYSGTGALQALPNTGTNNNAGYTTTSPEVQFKADFATSGTYYVWVRGYAISGNDDSIHAGINNTAYTSADRIANFAAGTYSWHRDTLDPQVATLYIGAGKNQTINFWMREDGFVIDKILLTTDNLYTPTGVGPTESPLKTVSGNFTSYYANTSSTIFEISNVSWTGTGVNQNNSLSIYVSADGGLSWNNATNGEGIPFMNGGTSLVYRAFFSSNGLSNLSLFDINISWTSEATPPPQVIINNPVNGLTLADVTPTLNVTINTTAKDLYYTTNNGLTNVTICTYCSGTITKFLYLKEGNFKVDVFSTNNANNISRNTTNFSVNMNFNYYDDFNDNSSLITLENVNWGIGNVSYTGRALSELAQNIQHGSAVISSGSYQTDIEITPISLNHSFLVFNYRVNDADPGDFLVYGNLTNSTTIHFESSSGQTENTFIYIEWYVAEFNDEVNVQRGTITQAVSTNTTIQPVTIGNSFPLISMMNDGTVYGTDDITRARLIGPDRLETYAVGNPADILAWQVIDYSGADVQNGSFTMTGTSQVIGLNRSVDTTKSFVIGTWAATNTGVGILEADNGGVLINFVNSTAINIERRAINTHNLHVSWYVVEFTAGESVRSGVAHFNSGDSEKNIPISSVNMNRTIVMISGNQRGGESSFTTSDNPGTMWVTGVITNTTNLRLERALTTSDADISWYVIEFGTTTSGNFVSYPINTTSSIAEILNVDWNESGTDANNLISVEISADYGIHYSPVIKGQGIINITSGNSLVYRVTFTTNSSNTISLSDMNISWTNTTSPPPNITINYPLQGTTIADVTPILNVSINGNANTLWYSVNNGSTNTTICTSCSGTFTKFLYLAEGGQNVRVYASNNLNEQSKAISNYIIDMNYNYYDSFSDNSSLITLNDVEWSIGSVNYTNPSQAEIKKVYKGSTFIPTGALSVDELIPAEINISSSFLTFSYSSNEVDPGDFLVYGNITNSTTIHFQSSTDATENNPVYIEWYIAEFYSGVRVRRGTFLQNAGTINTAINPALDLANSFPLASWMDDGATYGTTDNCRVTITESNSLETYFAANPNDVVAWQAIEYSGANVQNGVFSLTGVNDTIPLDMPVDLNKTFVIATFASSGDTTAGNGGLIVNLTDSSNIFFQRKVATGTLYVSWYAVEFNGGELVQSGVAHFNGPQNTLDIPLRNIDLSKSLVILPGNQKAGSSNYTANDNIGIMWARANLTNSTNLNLRREVTGEILDIPWYVVDFSRGTTANFTAYPINTTATITQIKNVSWLESGSDENNTISVQISPNNGNIWYNISNGGDITNMQSGRSLLYRVIYNSFTPSRTISLLDMNITWSNVITPPPQIVINSPLSGTTLADVTPTLNITLNDSASNLWYNINNGANISLCSYCSGTITKFLYLKEGNFNVSVFANNSVGNLSSNRTSFIINMNRNYYDSFNDNSSLYYFNNNLNWSIGNVSFTSDKTFNLLDSFETTNNWRFFGTGTWSINSYELLQTSNNEAFAVYLPFNVSTNYDYNISVTGYDPDDDWTGILFRYRNATDYYRCSFRLQTTDNAIVRVQGGVATNLVTTTTNYVQNQWNNYSVSVKNGNITCYLNGVAVLSAIDSTWKDGGIGIYENAHANTRYDNFDFYYIPLFANFTSYPINTTDPIKAISNITWNEFGTNQNNNISVNISVNGGSTWYSVNRGGILTGFTQGYNLLYRVFFNTNSSDNIIYLLDMNISWKAPPSVRIVYPLNTTYSSLVNSMNYTISGSSTPLDSCWYSLNMGETNTSITCGVNITGLISIEGNNTWFVYANDSEGSVGSASVTFGIDSAAPLITFINQTDIEDIIVNDSYPLQEGQNLSVRVNVSDNNLDRVWMVVWNTIKGGSQKLRSTLTYLGGILWIGIIPTDHSWNAFYYYTIYANDSAGFVSEYDNNFSILEMNISLEMDPLTVYANESVFISGYLNFTNGTYLPNHPFNLWVNGRVYLFSNVTANGSYNNFLNFSEDSSIEFDKGSYYNIVNDGENLTLASGNSSGNYSKIFDAGAIVKWTSIDWQFKGTSCTRTVSFQDGDVNSYSSTIDNYISSGSSSNNFGSSSELMLDTSPSVLRSLLKFDEIFGYGGGKIPYNSTISQANITLQVYVSGDSPNVYEILENWTELDSTYDDRLTGISWGSLGCAGSPSRSINLESTIDTSTTGAKTFDVSNVIRRWNNHTINNYGVVIHPLASNGVSIRSSDYITQSERPILRASFSSSECTGATFYVRTSNDNLTWGSWIEINKGENFEGIIGRFLQYKVELGAVDSTIKPYVSDIKINFTAVVTDENGYYNYNFTAPPSLGNYPIIVNSSYRTIFANNSLMLIVQVGLSPIVRLITPTHNTWFNYTPVDLIYNVSDPNLDLKNTSLIINGVINDTNQTELINGDYHTYTVNFSNGVYNWTVEAKDIANNTGTDSSRLFYIDLIDPNISIIYPPAYYSYNLNRINFSFNATDNLDSVLSCSIYLNDLLIAPAIISAGNGNATNVSYSGLSPGEYYWNVTCTDESMRKYSTSLFYFNVSDTPPEVYLVSPNQSTIDDDGNLTFTYNVTDNIEVAGGCFLLLNNIADIFNQSAVANGESNDLFKFNMNEGFYNWTVNCSDGNLTGQASPQRSLIIDLFSPNISLDSPIDGGIYNKSSFNFNFSVNDSIDNQLNCSIIMGGEIVDSGFSANSGILTNRPIENLTDGLKFWNVTCFDDALHESNSSTWNFTIAEPPIINLTTPNASSFTGSSVTLSYIPYDNTGISSCRLYVDNVFNQSNSSEIFIGNNNNFDIAGLSDGLHTWYINCSDYFNINGLSETRIFYLDNFPPNITLLQPSGEVHAANITFNFSVVDIVDSLLTCNLSVDSTLRAYNINATNGTITTWTVSGISEGNHTWYVNCSDDAGNSAGSSIFNFTKIIEPYVNLTWPANNYWFNSTNFNLSYLPQDDEGISRSYLFINDIFNKSNNTPVIVNQENNFSVNGLSDGFYNWTVNITDVRGLNATDIVRNFYIDTIPPLIEMYSPYQFELIITNNVSFNYNISDNLDSEIDCNLTVDGSFEFRGNLTSALNYSHYALLRDGNHSWSLICSDEARNINYSQIRNFSIIAPPNVTLDFPINNYRTNKTSFNFSYTPMDPMGFLNCSIFIDGVYNSTQGSINPNYQNNFSVIGMSEGRHNWTVECIDIDYNIYTPNYTNFTIDYSPPTIALIYPLNDSSLYSPNQVSFRWNASDRFDSNLTCNLTIDGINNKTNIPVLSGELYEENVSGLSIGKHYWNVSCWDHDIISNFNISLTWNFNLSKPDFSINSSDIGFSNPNPSENDLITINATIYNLGNIGIDNVVVRFYNGDPSSGGVQIGNDQNISISAYGMNITNVTWNANLGTNLIVVEVDPPIATNGFYREINETNNNASKIITVGAWEIIYGNVLDNSIFRLADNSSSEVVKWNADMFNNGNLFVSDYESIIDWPSLTAIWKATNGSNATNDFIDLDILFNMSTFVDSINETYTVNSIPKNITNFQIFGKTISDVPIVNSTNTTNFITGILWDSSKDSGNLQFDRTDKEDLVFVTKINRNKAGKYGIYDYEMRIPAKLRELKTTDTRSVAFYIELA
ncbi:MAG: DNRLRE domain-containing protein [Candidatus Pacearchaeota archaeon]|jgi:hypothetical protein